MAALLQCIFAFKQLEGLQVKMTELGKEALPLKELAARLLSYNEEVNASCKQEYLLINQSETDWTGLLAGLSLGQDKSGEEENLLGYCKLKQIIDSLNQPASEQGRLVEQVPSRKNSSACSDLGDN